ncbi:unnamed protein product [Prunus armeniaca]|uniref:Uncharacterized protein n=1 Tax=Prunus armeniaca TaxID=36596 RepID=A0A6J5W6D3_PRUAR|nr:unnamed protein product [Prunus armeniaca]
MCYGDEWGTEVSSNTAAAWYFPWTVLHALNLCKRENPPHPPLHCAPSPTVYVCGGGVVDGKSTAIRILGNKELVNPLVLGFPSFLDSVEAAMLTNMYSLTVKPSFFLPKFSTSSSSASSSSLHFWPGPCSSSVTFRIKTKNRGSRLRIHAYESSKSDSPNGSGDSKPPNGTLPKSRREILLEYVKNVQPEFMELFVKRAPQQVVDAMRQTVTNMIGTLPPQFFAVTVTTVAENLAQLMYSIMMTGYMFQNAQYRLELQQGLEPVALPDVQDKKDAPDYAPGTQKNVSGEVIRWNNVSGPERIDAKKYIELLEAEIEELNHQVGRKSASGQNELLEYLKSLEPQNLKELTSSAGDDVVVAMNTFIKRLLAVSDPGQMKTSVTETSAPELAKLLYWLMVVGYSIRNIEVRFDMERVLGTPPKLAELPPGENV